MESQRPFFTTNVTVIDHPLVQHKLTLLREKERSTSSFRTLLAEISMLLVYEVTRDMPLVYREIETPLATMRAPLIDGKKVVLLNILRAGTGMVEGMLRILPSARVGQIGAELGKLFIFAGGFAPIERLDPAVQLGAQVLERGGE